MTIVPNPRAGLRRRSCNIAAPSRISHSCAGKPQERDPSLLDRVLGTASTSRLTSLAFGNGDCPAQLINACMDSPNAGPVLNVYASGQRARFGEAFKVLCLHVSF